MTGSRSGQHPAGPQGGSAPSTQHAPLRENQALTMVKAFRKLRNARNSALPAGLFQDPRWEMLIELFLAEGTGSRVSTSEIISVGGIAPTTGLRHLGRLEKAGMIDRLADPEDGRRIFIRLREEARAMMLSYFSAVRDAALAS